MSCSRRRSASWIRSVSSKRELQEWILARLLSGAEVRGTDLAWVTPAAGMGGTDLAWSLPLREWVARISRDHSRCGEWLA